MNCPRGRRAQKQKLIAIQQITKQRINRASIHDELSAWKVGTKTEINRDSKSIDKLRMDSAVVNKQYKDVRQINLTKTTRKQGSIRRTAGTADAEEHDSNRLQNHD
jgi:hypothetical protein